jgi:SAM-dependent methyltransferase
MTGFADQFSSHAREYARYRPRYPRELFEHLASLTPRHELAWDVGTGSGQAALGLAAHFDRVVATDASAEQLARAVPHERIEYHVERAEDVSLAPGSVDLVTVAVAVHWFDFDAFYSAVRRVGAKHGVIAVWTYEASVIDPAVDPVLHRYDRNVLAGYWPDRVEYIFARYETLPFPFEELPRPSFELVAEWDLPQLIGFLQSWSGSRRYMEQRGADPVEAIRDELGAAWGDASRRRTVRWPLHFRIGRIG